MRRHVGAAAAGLLLLVGCTSGSSDDDGTDASPSGTIDPAEARRAPGVTDDTIKVGVTYVDLEAIRDVTNLDHGDYEAAYQALFDDINAAGGIRGRRVEPVFAPVSPIGTQPAEEACLRLTEDEQVFAVMGFFQADAPLCFVEAHQTAVIGGMMTDERLERAAAPWYTTEAGSDLEVDTIRTFSDEGLLDGEVAVFATNQDEALLNDTVVPLLEDLGIEPVATGVLDAPENDVAAQNAATAVIVERFESAGADKVLVVGTGALPWANGIEPTGYRPQTLFTNLNSVNAYVEDEAGRDLSVIENAVVGALYTAPPGEALDEPTVQDCFAIQEEAGIEIADPQVVPDGDPQQYVASSSACWNVTLFRAIAEAAGDDLNYGTFRQAGDDLGEVTIPGYPDPFTYGAPPAADGDPPVYLFEWDAAAESFVVQEP